MHSLIGTSTQREQLVNEINVAYQESLSADQEKERLKEIEKEKDIELNTLM